MAAALWQVSFPYTTQSVRFSVDLGHAIIAASRDLSNLGIDFIVMLQWRNIAPPSSRKTTQSWFWAISNSLIPFSEGSCLYLGSWGAASLNLDCILMPVWANVMRLNTTNSFSYSLIRMTGPSLPRMYTCDYLSLFSIISPGLSITSAQVYTPSHNLMVENGSASLSASSNV